MPRINALQYAEIGAMTRLCKCDCGEPVPMRICISGGKEYPYYPKFIPGHRASLHRSGYIRAHEAAVVNAPPCGCGCREPVGVYPAQYFIDNRMLSYTYPHYLPGHNARILKQSMQLTTQERQILIGSLLGDGCLSFAHDSAEAPRFSENHSSKQSSYVHWKAKQLTRFEPAITYHDNPGHGKAWCSLRLPTLLAFTELYHLRYPEPTYALVQELDWLGVAVWYMDDGSWNGGSARFHTNGFKKHTVLLLRDWFLQSGIDCSAKFSKGWELWLSREGTRQLVTHIRPLLIDSMRYKLGG